MTAPVSQSQQLLDDLESEMETASGSDWDWCFLSERAKACGAARHEVKIDGSYKTGRARYRVLFADRAGRVIDFAEAMRLRSKAGNPYFVCRKPLMLDENETPTL